MFKKLFSRKDTTRNVSTMDNSEMINVLDHMRGELEHPTDDVLEYKSAHDSWLVRWRSRHGQFSGETKDEVEIFLSEAEAKAFKRQLELSFKLLKYTCDTNVTMEKNA